MNIARFRPDGVRERSGGQSSWRIGDPHGVAFLAPTTGQRAAHFSDTDNADFHDVICALLRFNRSPMSSSHGEE
jgi:hypothetical protein